MKKRINGVIALVMTAMMLASDLGEIPLSWAAEPSGEGLPGEETGEGKEYRSIDGEMPSYDEPEEEPDVLAGYAEGESVPDEEPGRILPEGDDAKDGDPEDEAGDASGNEGGMGYQAYGSDAEAGDITYDFDAVTGILTITGSGAMENYTVSDRAPWYSDKDAITSVVVESGVTGIGHYAFADLSVLAEVSLPDTIKSIGFKAFSNCTALTDINIPSGWETCPTSNASGTVSTEFCGHIFEGCESLRSVTIPYGMTELPSYAFSYAEHLEEISLPGSLTVIKNHAFYYCEALKKVMIPADVVEIGKSAFCDCGSLKEAVMGDKVESIGHYAFYECVSLTELVLPDSVRSIGYSAFAKCVKLSSINIPSGWEECTSADSSGKRSTQYCGHIFEGDKELVALAIPEGMTAIPAYAFCYADGLEGITFPESLATIGICAFYGCKSLQAVNVPDTVTSIPKSAFYGCSSLQYVILGNYVDSIGHYAFYGCSSLGGINLPDTVRAIGYQAFYNCTKLSSINIPLGWEECTSSSDAGTQSVDYCGHIFQGCSKLKSVSVPVGMEVLPAFAFTSANYLEEIQLPQTLKEIKNQGFYGCSSMESIELPYSLEKIGRSAFYSCSKLWYISIPDTVTVIPSYAFYGCKALEGILLHDNITSIGFKAFFNCESLATFSYPLSWTECGSDKTDGSRSASTCGHIFYGCKSLKEITIPEGVTRIPDYAFNQCNCISTINLPSTLTSIGSYAFAHCTSLVVQKFPEGLSEIGEHAYDYCSSLRAADIPKGLVRIGPFSFSYCNNLQVVSIPETVTEIDKNAFSGTSNINYVYYEGDQTSWEAIAKDSRLTKGNVSYGVLCNYREPDTIRDKGYVKPAGSKFDSFYGGYASVNGDASTYRLVDPSEATFGPDRNELFFSLPQNSYVTYGFDNALLCPPKSVILFTTTGNEKERVDVYLETLSGKTIFVGTDYETTEYHTMELGDKEEYVIGVKMIGRDLGGNCPGFDVVNFALMAQDTDYVSPIMSNTKAIMTRAGKTYDLFTEEQAFEVGSSELVTIAITPYWDGNSEGKIALMQGDEEVTANTSGAFVDIQPGALFGKGKKIYVALYNKEEKLIDRRELKIKMFDSEAFSSAVPAGKYRIRVKSEKKEALSGVEITFRVGSSNEQKLETNSDGYADFDLQPSWGQPQIEATKAGYITWSNQDLDWSLSSSRYEEIKMYPDEVESYYLLNSATVSNGLDTLICKNLLTQTKTLYLSSKIDIIGGDDFTLKCKAIKPDKVSRYILLQAGKEIKVSADGVFALNTAMFSEGGGCEIMVEPSDGSAGVTTPINLKFAKKQDEKFEVAIGKDTSFKIGMDVPFIGGSEFSCDMPLLPIDLLATEDKVHIGINVKGFQKYKDDKEWDKFCQTLETALKAGKTPMKKSAIEDLVKDYKGAKLPGFEEKDSLKPKVNVVGYLEMDLGSAVATGKLYFEVSGKIGKNTTFMVGAVPVVVDFQFTYGAKIGGEVNYNFKTKVFNGRVFLDPSVGLEVFGGVGVGKVVGVGAYGSGNLSFQINLVDSNNNTGLRKCDLSAEAGLKAYLGPFEYKKTVAYHTWNLYTAKNKVKSGTSSDEFENTIAEAGESWFDSSDIAAYSRADLAYLAEESAWNGAAGNALLANGDGAPGRELGEMGDVIHETLLSTTYQNANPVVVSDGVNAWMTFLRADRSTGDIYAVVSRYDYANATWSEPVRIDESAKADEKPDLICVGADLFLVYSQAKAGYANSGDDVLEYAKNRQIRLVRLDKETLSVVESRTYDGAGYVAGQSFSMVDGKPVMAYKDSSLTDADSIFHSPNTGIYLVDLSTEEKEAVKFAESSEPVEQIVPGKHDGKLCVAYITMDHKLYVAGEGTSTLMKEDVSGRLVYDNVPGTGAADFMWNEADELHALSGLVLAAEGITEHYDIQGNSIYYSAVSDKEDYKTAVRRLVISGTDTEEPSVEVLYDEKYFENLNAFAMNGKVYLAGMNTSAEIGYDDMQVTKDLVWLKLDAVHDVRLDAVSFDDSLITAGDDVPVTISVSNQGEAPVSSIDVFADGILVSNEAVDLPVGGSADVTIHMTCPEDKTTYVISVSETDVTESSLRYGDNSKSITMCLPDLAVELELFVEDGEKELGIVVTNRGGSKAQGTVVLYDNAGEPYYTGETELLDTEDVQIVRLPVPAKDKDRFLGTVKAELINIGEDLYEYNNVATKNADWFSEGQEEEDPPVLEQAAEPVATPGSGAIISGTDSIALTSDTPNAVIYYTTDGTSPTTGSAVYSGPILAGSVAVDNKITINAIAVAEGYAQSDTVIFTWVLGETIKITKLALDKTALNLSVGESATLVPSFTPVDATNTNLIWSSTDAAVAKVEPGGIVTALAAGEATISAETMDGSGLSATCLVTVGGTVSSTGSAFSPVPQIDENTKELYLVKGQKFTLDESGWQSGNKKYLTVSKKNLVTAKKAGYEPIELFKGSRIIKVYISEPALSKKSAELMVGEDRILRWISFDSTHLPVYWYSSAPDVATVSQNGVVTGVGKGSATVTAVVNGKAYNCKIKVTENARVLERSLHMTQGAKKALKIKGVKFTSWISDDTTVVSVAKNKLYAAGCGETVVRAEGDGKVYIVHVYVEKPEISSKYVVKTGTNKYKLNLSSGKSTQLYFSDVAQPMIFKSNKGDVAYMDENGMIRAHIAGKAKLTTKINGKTITITVNVR
ncbi:MAG: leucine-rich repeat protein [Lachnospiraceae bacterium]|nr:leucine-rich repeat protein [Lachnospiraceae bacterium]